MFHGRSAQLRREAMATHSDAWKVSVFLVCCEWQPLLGAGSLVEVLCIHLRVEKESEALTSHTKDKPCGTS